MDKPFDIIVIGGGHAGCEAALVCARMGLFTAMVTLQVHRIGYMPCNPAVGGLAKGHLVKEIDALGGEIGRATDQAGIQFRMLNRGKGPAVWSPRAQVDKYRYADIMRYVVENQKNLSLVPAEVTRIVIQHGAFQGVELGDGTRLMARACVLTTGTFLKGLMHIGETKVPGGREGEPETTTLSASLRASGFRLGRLKTGTPPRVLRCSVDLQQFEPQAGDSCPTPFSYRTKTITQSQELCYLTHTNAVTHDVVRQHIDRAPMYRGDIDAIGTRYCPSIEDKVVRFPDKIRHQIFIEPEGRDHPELYLNGISTSMPVDVQLKILQSVPGLDTAIMRRPGYAVEYDFFPPDQLKRTLESKHVDRLFFAGQVNGTSGYEEAAAQGFMAGVNAVLKTRGKPPFTLGRDEAYIGVLIDDLTTKDIDEPYRMFTSRAEFRLSLRQDNADERLMAYGVELGLIPLSAWDGVQKRMRHMEEIIGQLERTPFPTVVGNPRFAAEALEPVAKPSTLAQVLRRPQVRFRHVQPYMSRTVHGGNGLDRHVECAVKYVGYLERQERDIQTVREMEAQAIPEDFPYHGIHGLSTEARQKLMIKRPETMAQASRISGVRASDLSIIAVHLQRSGPPKNGRPTTTDVQKPRT
ncbi:MAG: tRNA uridine-5-carboxymethylaminomethyl(34) synthesis enzyme MnmG [Candidatus Krumholzibacteria bacterium]|nr:tRNA uridine-5-carboxymethylaminomethyl(34) synthesis enzyme MnmG [Candidatus Krumholzibacteria bacterium]